MARYSVSQGTMECQKTGISSSDRIYVSKLGSLAVLWGTSSMTLNAGIPAWSGKQIAVIPEGYRPASELRVPIVSDGAVATMLLKPSGAVEVLARSSKVANDSGSPTNVTISAVYPLAL